MNCYTSIPKTLGLLLLALVMCGVSYFAATISNGFAAGISWFGLVFFGAAALVIGAQLVSRKPAVMIDHEGISVARLGNSRVTWQQVTGVSLMSLSSNTFLCISLSDEDAFVSRLGPVARLMIHGNRSLGFPALMVSFRGLTPGVDEAYAYIQTVFHRPRPPMPIRPYR